MSIFAIPEQSDIDMSQKYIHTDPKFSEALRLSEEALNTLETVVAINRPFAGENLARAAIWGLTWKQIEQAVAELSRRGLIQAVR